jgi:sugar transferase (PEP-CTERM/EpsH1 system associated)
MAKFAMAPPLRETPMVLDMVDVDSEKWNALAQTATWPIRAIYRREARTLREFERLAVWHARQTLVINERERALLRTIAPDAAISIVHNGVDLAGLHPQGPPSSAPVVVFCGVMNYTPNVEGVLWFARHVWPRVLDARPDAQFFVVGADPAADIRRLAHTHASIAVTGTVPDVRRYLWDSAVSVAPLLTARGTQNKVLEAIAAGLPVVVTTPVMEGVPELARVACRTADEPATFARHVSELLALSGTERHALASRADMAQLTWDQQLRVLPALLAAAARG